MKKMTQKMKKDLLKQLLATEYPNCSKLKKLLIKFIYITIAMQIPYFRDTARDAMLENCLEKNPCKYVFVENGQVYNCQCGKCF
jgi:hypothetical protein